MLGLVTSVAIYDLGIGKCLKLKLPTLEVASMQDGDRYCDFQ